MKSGRCTLRPDSNFWPLTRRHVLPPYIGKQNRISHLREFFLYSKRYRVPTTLVICTVSWVGAHSAQHQNGYVGRFPVHIK